MKIKRNKRNRAEVFTASLNDIMFFLMLFFLIVGATAARATMDVVLPSSKTSSDTSIRNHIDLTVTADMKYYVNKQELTFDQIEPVIAAEMAQKQGQETIVLLHADRSLNLQDVVSVFDIGNHLGVKMILFTQKTK